jgi:Tc toxin complex TcA C-terminal TcB-binding domain/Neuraminidase-like domain
MLSFSNKQLNQTIKIMATKTKTPQDNRLDLFQYDLGKNKALHTTFKTLYKEKKGDWTEIQADLTSDKGFTSEVVKNLSFTHALSEWSNDNIALVKVFQKDKTTFSMRDIALHFDKAQFTDKLIQEQVTPTDSGVVVENYGATLHNALFHIEPTAVVQNMLQNATETPISDPILRGGITTFLNNQDEAFNIKTTSIYTAFKAENAFEGIAPELHEGLKTELKTLQRVAAISPVAEAIPVLMKAKMHTAYQVSEMPESQFIAAFKDQLGENGAAIAQQLHTNAVNGRIRNEHALMALKEARQGTGIAFIDKSLNVQEAAASTTRGLLDKQDLNWDLLFGDADLCECGECTSVYSAAAYFVELLQYLRNNNLDPNLNNDPSIRINPDPKSILGTPLQKLFDRRPDLACLELTCANTNTILPYVDLVNEVMENYVASKILKPFNVADETSGELLSQPQHTTYQAYAKLKDEVYPFTLPYHQPIDAARIYLDSLGTSRFKLIDTFRSTRKGIAFPDTDADNTEGGTLVSPMLDDMHKGFIDRAADAEFLGLTKEEYVILTKEAFVSKYYWDAQTNLHDDTNYAAIIGVKPVPAYYGYKSVEIDTALAEMNDTTTGQGLTFVKKQFLPRTGIEYVDLVELLKTQSLNPNMPQGKALSIMERIDFSYRYLQTQVDIDPNNELFAYEKLIEFLSSHLKPKTIRDPCHAAQKVAGVSNQDVREWVGCHFEKIGKMLVLEGNSKYIDGKIEIQSLWGDFTSTLFVENGEILQIIGSKGKESIEKKGTIDVQTGQVLFDSSVEITDLGRLVFIGKRGERGFFTRAKGTKEEEIYLIIEQKDTCELDTVRLTHLDGTPVSEEEYDRIHRFIRLWRKMSWTIDETDKALVGLSAVKKEEKPDDCEDSSVRLKTDCNITPRFLQQLVSVKKLLDKTGLELGKLLAFWTNISTSGDKSLYKRLFLTHILASMDSVFKADTNGYYLMPDVITPIEIGKHKPVIMAALNLSSDDMDAFMFVPNMTYELTLENLSLMYRYRLLSKVLGVRILTLIEVLPLFGDPFTDANTTLEWLERWGKMEDAGFTHQALNYIIQSYDDSKKPLSPNEKTLLQLGKTLYEGLNAIDEAHKDVTNKPTTTTEADKKLEVEAQATSEIVQSKAALLFDPSVVVQIMGILEGTSVYITTAPKDLTITLADDKSLKKKFKYDKTGGHVQITGILTDAERMDFKGLRLLDADWQNVLIRLDNQQNKDFKTALYTVFEAEKAKQGRRGIVEAAESIIKAGDISLALDQIPEGQPDTNTAVQKRVAFLNVFLPYLRQELTHRFVVATLSNLVGLGSEITDVLISEVLMSSPSSSPIYTIFEKIRRSAKPVGMDWQGYLIPSVDADYTFIVKETSIKPQVLIEGVPPFDWELQLDNRNEWWAKTPIKLQAGKLYKLSVTGIDLKNVYWKTATSAITVLPPSVLLPDFALDDCKPAFVLLRKAAMLVSNFNFSADEIRYFHKHQADFGDLKFYQLSFEQWLRLEAYTRLRNALPETKTNILAFFNWATTVWTTVQEPIEKAKLSAKIAELTLWKKERVDKLIAENHFNIHELKDYRNEENLLKLQNALAVADKVGMDIDLLFDWAKPTSNFQKSRSIADSIEKAIRAQYKQTDWEQVVKPLSDKLRNNQKEALIAYLLQQPELQTWGVTDADGLFEYFLIDVQMDACMETSRIKQAISSVQLFVMRCFLGLEEEGSGIKPTVLDRERWNWMERYRVWEANRKVFLYPENWIESNLRDDKSPFFKELESELLQKDINKQNVTDALKTYLYKVDEVANMEVVGLYIDGTRTGATWSEGAKLHVFSRTRNAPYFFYYRYLALDEMNWYAWEKMQVDIPSYDVEDTRMTINGIENPNYTKIIGNGCYLTPVVWNGRLLIFFPQFMKKTKPNPVSQTGRFSELANSPTGIQNSKPIEYFEIKMAWSEYRNGKWIQKQLSKDVYTNTEGLNRIELFKFVPIISYNSFGTVLIGISYENSPISSDMFIFDGNSLKFGQRAINNVALTTNQFHYNKVVNNKSIKTLQIGNQLGTEINPLSDEYVFEDTPYNGITYRDINFFNSFTKDLLGIINTGQLEAFFKFNTWGSIDKADTFGEHGRNNYHELKRPYSLYNWELFFHTPMMLADALSKAQQFEEAMKWYHFVFNPMGDPDPSVNDGSDKRFWQFSPFKDTNSQRILDRVFNSLEPNKKDEAINEWRNKPFMPHVVARSRPVAYMKWVVMKYIDNLVAWGDYLFRQDTIESINQATQLYVLAGHILGKRPMSIPKRGKTKPQTYLGLLDKWDAFGNAMVELELIAPFSNQITTNKGNVNGVTGLANIFGFSTALYFCMPNNPKLVAYWDTVGDRLFKIRHCQNIEGIFRKLPLFEPPIDPALLVKAAAQGLSIASVLNDLNTPMPNYRFYYLLQKALELCNELKSLGGAMLSAIEKKDNEAIALMRAKHESTMHNLVMEVKKLQLEEAQKSLETLVQNRKSPEHRMKYYLQLIGEDAGRVPGLESDFSEIVNAIETPVNESGLKLIRFEKEDMDRAAEAQDFTRASGISETLAGIFHLIPNFEAKISPFGVGVGVGWGGSFLGGATQAVAKGLQVRAGDLSYSANNASKKGGFTRAIQDRIMQANAAGYEIKQIDKQITAQEIRIEMSNLEIKNQQQQIDNANEVEEFLKNKYTNEELYTWMRGSLKTLYHQVYSLAYDLAKKAEKTYRFERGLSNSNFIQSGYWDAGRDGLLAGEQLYVGLKQLEAAYQENRGYDYEITKHISLRQINPMAVLQLKETGKCEFMLPEVLFDMDFPNHFKRRIKSVSLSIPCVAGPYTNINATLRLMENKFRNTAIGGKTYAEKTEETDERFSTFIIPISAIAASSAQNESGMFELNFKDERYLPFEGAGVISKWRLELPDFRQFDYDTISDVVVHVRYISTEGGERLKKTATESTQKFMSNVEELGQQEGLFSIIDLKHDFPTEWHKIGADNKLAISIRKGNFQYFAQNKTITITNCQYYNNGNLAAGGVEATITPPQTNLLIAHDTSTIPDITIADKDNGFHYLVIRFTLG